MDQPFRLLAAALAISLVAALGCSREKASPPSERELLTRLPVTMATEDDELRRELERLERLGQLPWQQQPRRIRAEENAAAVLASQFARVDAEPLAAEAAPLLTSGLELSLTDQELAREMLHRFDAQRRASRQALELPDASFGIDPAAGLMAKLESIPRSRLIVRLEALAAAQALGRLGPEVSAARETPAASSKPQASATPGTALPAADNKAGATSDAGVSAMRETAASARKANAANAVVAQTDREEAGQDKPDLDSAIAAVDAIFRWVDCLASEPHPVCRLEAIHLRGEALLVLETVAQHPEVTAVQLEQLEELVKRSLAKWPDDADTCVAEQVLGMQMYELVRNGQAEAVGSEIPSKDVPTDLVRRVRRMKSQQIDRDQLYYLRAMDRIAQGAGKDFPDRQPVFKALRASAGQPTDDDFPAIAMHVLLGDVERLHRFLTFDRARMEAWAVALAAARGEDSPALHRSPRTGKAYRVDHRPDRVAVWEHGSLEASEKERPIVVRKVQP